ncbi:unnamed protein product [Rotaria sordida]|uniref:Ethylene receptor 1-like N-terminal domain-containing protein n=1 Tax=Rotaria sordida TaxID=392033 RepID=A0A815H7A7_9BILA|nr:unnamed protein product [Rotaria sordida]
MLSDTATSFQSFIDVTSDIFIAIAYFSIPLELLYFLKHYPTTVPNKYKSIVIMFALFIVLCGLTHTFNALHLSINTIIFTKLSTAIISVITAMALFILIPSVLSFLSYAKALEEEVLTEPEPSSSPEIKAYLNKRRSNINPRWHVAIDYAMTNRRISSQQNLVEN